MPSEEIAEKRQQKDKKTAFLLGLLFVASPVAKMIGDAIMDEIEVKLVGTTAGTLKDFEQWHDNKMKDIEPLV